MTICSTDGVLSIDVNDSASKRDVHGRPPVGHVKFRVDVLQVYVHGFFCNGQSLGDLTPRSPIHEQPEDFHLSCRQRRLGVTFTQLRRYIDSDMRPACMNRQNEPASSSGTPGGRLA